MKLVITINDDDIIIDNDGELLLTNNEGEALSLIIMRGENSYKLPYVAIKCGSIDKVTWGGKLVDKVDLPMTKGIELC